MKPFLGVVFALSSVIVENRPGASPRRTSAMAPHVGVGVTKGPEF